MFAAVYADASSAAGRSYVATQAVIFALQGLVTAACLVLLFLHLWRRPQERRSRPSRQAVGLLLVLGSSVVDIVYTAMQPPGWHQWALSQPAEAALWALGDLFLAFDCSAYALLAAMWLAVRSWRPLTLFSGPALALLLACTLLPFLTVLICFVIRSTASAQDQVVAQYLFFAVLVALCLLYGIVIVASGAAAIRALALAPIKMGTDRKTQLRRVSRHVVAAGVVLLLAIVALVALLTVPTPDPVSAIWVTSFAPQIVFFATQLPLLWLFRSREATATSAHTQSVHSQTRAATSTDKSSGPEVDSAPEVPEAERGVIVL